MTFGNFLLVIKNLKLWIKVSRYCNQCEKKQPTFRLIDNLRFHLKPILSRKLNKYFYFTLPSINQKKNIDCLLSLQYLATLIQNLKRLNIFLRDQSFPHSSPIRLFYKIGLR